MSGIVLQTNAIKIVNRGGGYPTKVFKHQTPGGSYHSHMTSIVMNKGTDYVVFKCPAPRCGKRNKRPVYEAKAQTKDGRLSFKCNGCYREIEVQRPIQNIQIPEPMIEGQIRPGTLFDPNGRPIGV